MMTSLLADEESKMVASILDWKSREQPFELKIFNNIDMLNWAWIYYSETVQEWVQFDCIVCMIIESKWQQHLQGCQVQFSIVHG